MKKDSFLIYQNYRWASLKKGKAKNFHGEGEIKLLRFFHRQLKVKDFEEEVIEDVPNSVSLFFPLLY